MLNIICIPALIRIVFEGIQYAKGIIPRGDLCISFSLIIDEKVAFRSCSVFPARSYILYDRLIPALVILTIIWVARVCNPGNPITWPPLHIVGARHCP